MNFQHMECSRKIAKYILAIALIASGAYLILIGDANKVIYNIALYISLIIGVVILITTMMKNRK